MSYPTKKRFLHKIYNGATYVATIADDLILNRPRFSWSVNGGMGEMNIDLGLTLNDFRENYENDSIVFGRRIKTFIQGSDETTATQIYDGILVGYEPVVSEDGTELIRLRVASQATTLENIMLRSGSNTTITYSSQSPDTILKDLIDKYAGTIIYTASSVAATGTTVSYTFSFMSFLEGVNICLKLAPAYWYWYVDATSVLFFQLTDFDTIDHELFIGKHVKDVQATKSIDDVKNVVYFKGGGDPPLYKKYERTSSVTEYGERAERMSDERVTAAATASAIATKFLDEKDHPISTLRVTVMDNSIDTEKGYDIESFRPGDVVKITDPQYGTKQTLWDVGSWDVDFWDFDIRYSLGLPMQIQRIDYDFHSATLELVQQPDDVMKRIEDINRNLENVRSEGIPTAPT